MREILFRGKRLDNGEWVEGYLGQDTIIGDGKTWLGYVIKSIPKKLWDCDWFEIDPDTIGQYTGLMDENGKRIFEGDIVRYYERQFGGEDEPVNQSVGYEEGGFCVRRYFLNNWLRNAVGGNIQMEGIEIIGNIHDNPELLKGE